MIMYIFWIASLIGILIVTFTNFQYLDLNVIVGVLFIFTLVNTYFIIKEKR